MGPLELFKIRQRWINFNLDLESFFYGSLGLSVEKEYGLDNLINTMKSVLCVYFFFNLDLDMKRSHQNILQINMI